MSQNDTGIDCCDLEDTIVQCKLRKENLNWRECATFFGSQTIFSEEQNKTIIRWNNLIISRNNEFKLSGNLLTQSKKYIDIGHNTLDIIDYCENLLLNPPKYPKNNIENFKLRDYQIEAINLIKKNKQNIIINIPTGCGKNMMIEENILDNYMFKGDIFKRIDFTKSHIKDRLTRNDLKKNKFIHITNPITQTSKKLIFE